MNAVSRYPDAIDEMIFFQDNGIEKMDVVNQYNDLISRGKYDDANEYISRHTEIYGFFANYMNALENRICNLQEYLLSKRKKNPFTLSDDEPEQAENGTVWI